jgi:hypothetical protein
MAKKGVVDIHGKSYKTVIMRVNEFREHFKPDDGWCIRTWLISNEGDRVVIQASICDKDDHVVATGFAEEDRTQGKINKTSALENCETSSIGRALAAFGLGGEEYCSADELVNALDQQGKLPKAQPKTLKDEPEEKEQEKKEKRKKFDPTARIIKWCERTTELLGFEEADKLWVRTLRRNPEHSHGCLSLKDMKKNRDVSFSDLRKISDKAKEMYITASEPEEE